jgi:RNA polymerase sigma factor (sigma-70 family)
MTDSVWKTRETLLTRIRDRHDDASWEDFVYYYRRYIYNLVRRMNVGHHDADEVTQKVIIKAWQKLPEFRYDPGRGRFRGWLCMVAGNEVKDFFRSRKRTCLMTDLQNAEGGKETDFEDFGNITEPEIEKIAEHEWRNYVVKLAWKNLESALDEKAKNCFLGIAHGDTPREIAKRLEIAESSVYVYKKRVQDKLRVEVMRLNRELL